MNNFFLHTADIFFLVFHTALILFNLMGWLWKKTRKWNLFFILLTLASWFILGIFYGTGYCPLTDWHFDILRRLGHTELPYSYIQYLVERITGFSPKPDLVEIVTVAGIFVALSFSLIVNIRDWRQIKVKRYF